MIHVEGKPPHCLACGASLHGVFCSACGQRHVEPSELGVWTLITEGSDWRDKWRLFLDIGWLFLAPGHLTRAWLAGDRKKHINPLKASFICAGAASVLATNMPLETWLAISGWPCLPELDDAQRAALHSVLQLENALTVFVTWTLAVLGWPLALRIASGGHPRGLIAFVVAALHLTAAGAATGAVLSLSQVLLGPAPLPLLAAALLCMLALMLVQLLTVLRMGLGLTWGRTAMCVVAIGIATWMAWLPAMAIELVYVQPAIAETIPGAPTEGDVLFTGRCPEGTRAATPW